MLTMKINLKSQLFKKFGASNDKDTPTKAIMDSSINTPKHSSDDLSTAVTPPPKTPSDPPEIFQLLSPIDSTPITLYTTNIDNENHREGVDGFITMDAMHQDLQSAFHDSSVVDIFRSRRYGLHSVRFDAGSATIDFRVSFISGKQATKPFSLLPPSPAPAIPLPELPTGESGLYAVGADAWPESTAGLNLEDTIENIYSGYAAIWGDDDESASDLEQYTPKEVETSFLADKDLQLPSTGPILAASPVQPSHFETTFCFPGEPSTNLLTEANRELKTPWANDNLSSGSLSSFDSFYSTNLPYYEETFRGVPESLEPARPDSFVLGASFPSISLDSSHDAWLSDPHPVSKSVPPLAIQANANPDKISLSNFQIVKGIGQGSSGGVYHVIHKKHQTRHALKVVFDVYGRDRKERKEGLVGWLVEEQSALRSVTGVDGFISLDASWSDTKNFYFLSPLYATDLECEIRRCGRLPRERYAFYFSQLVLALHSLHSLGVIHRDIKPANLMIDFEGNLVIVDFGLSHEFITKPSFDERTTQPYYPYWSTDDVTEYTPRRPVETLTYIVHGSCGSPVHMAPEIWLQQPHSFPVDWWSAGTVLYMMATGRYPFWVPFHSSEADLGHKIVHDELTFEPEDKLHVETKHLLGEMLRKKPEDRLPIAEIESHPFFHNLNWDAMRKHEIPPPYVPPQEATHVLNGCSRPLAEGQAFEDGSNPCPEFDYTSPALQQTTAAAPSEFGASFIGEALAKPRMKTWSLARLWSRVFGTRKEVMLETILSPSIFYPKAEGTHQSTSEDDDAPSFLEALHPSRKHEHVIALDDHVALPGPLKSAGSRSIKNRLRHILIPRARPRPAGSPRYDLLA